MQHYILFRNGNGTMFVQQFDEESFRDTFNDTEREWLERGRAVISTDTDQLAVDMIVAAREKFDRVSLVGAKETAADG